jgi:hypothetical protein
MLLAALVCYCCGRQSDASDETGLRDDIRRVLGKSPPSRFDDETTEQRSARLDAIADDIAAASRDRREAAALLAIGQMESGWAEYVGAGCRYPGGIPKGAGHCDRGLSRSYWQMKQVACRPGWALSRGSRESQGVFAVCARKRFLGALRRCQGRHPGGDIAGAMAGYRSANCSWEGREHDGARARGRLYHLRLSQLRGGQ